MRARSLPLLLGILGGAAPLLPAHGLDYPVECSGAAVDADVDAAIGQASSGPVRLLLSSGTCLIESTHQLNGAIAFSIAGSGMTSTIVKGQGLAIPMFLVGGMAGGVDFGLQSLTLQDAPQDAIVISYSTLRVDAVRFSDNKSGNAILAEFSAVAIANSRFEGNMDQEGTIRMGGGLYGSLSVTDTVFVDNGAEYNGGAISANVFVGLDRVLFAGQHGQQWLWRCDPHGGIRPLDPQLDVHRQQCRVRRRHRDDREFRITGGYPAQCHDVRRYR
jgi:predicted outer membrane repeat protein